MRLYAGMPDLKEASMDEIVRARGFGRSTATAAKRGRQGHRPITEQTGDGGSVKVANIIRTQNLSGLASASKWADEGWRQWQHCTASVRDRV